MPGDSASPRGLVLAAPASGGGKTTVTLGLLRALRRAGVAVAGAKAGPDYIDPRFHAAACGRTAYNFDPWAMRPALLRKLAGRAAAGTELLLVEGVMGLFDGADGGAGSTADLAAALGLPVVLVLDVRGQAQSAAAVLRGFAALRPDVTVAGAICNRVGGPRHARLIEEAMAPLGIPLLGHLPRAADLTLPSRHLGLVQAEEHPDLEAFLEAAADAVAAHLDLSALRVLAAPLEPAPQDPSPLPPPGQRVAVARDAAFAFAYPHLLEGWRTQGAELGFFSPLTDEAPAAEADAVYLPGGYPELHAGRLAGNAGFLDGLRAAAARGATLFSECGGYMVLGEALTDAEGARHAMAGLLPVETSFAERRLHLGYRAIEARAEGFWGPAGTRLRGHEFHFATVVRESGAESLFACLDTAGRDLGAAGLRQGSVSGSFLHLIDRAA